MKIIGLTGGIGSGKTAALNILHDDYGAFIMEADALAHRLMEPGQKSYRDITASFGKEILAEDRTIDRSRLSAVVFGDHDKLELLNAITHPNVKEAVLESIKEQKAAGCDIYVLEAALLIQDGYLSICDEMWFVYADLDTRIGRLCAYRQFTREKALKVIEAQAPDSYYEAHCIKKIDNSGDLDSLRKQISAALHT